MPADAKPVSATRLVMAQEMTPQDANPAGNVHGGNIMRLDDEGKPVEVPKLRLETAEDRRRNEEARQRAIARKQRQRK
jgi:acyl-CoA hydrolase